MRKCGAAACVLAVTVLIAIAGCGANDSEHGVPADASGSTHDVADAPDASRDAAGAGDATNARDATVTIDAAVPDSIPRGVYILDSAPTDGGFFQHREQNIRDLPYIDGYVYRGGWARMQPTSAANYDFSDLDVIVPKLQRLHQKLTILSFVDPPFLAQIATSTWNATADGSGQDGGASGIVHAVPWDAAAQTAFANFVSALAAHPIPDADQGGAMVPLAQHSVLTTVSLGVPGMPELRFGNPAGLSQAPGYSRDALLGAARSALQTVQAAFPTKRYYQGLWPIKDEADEKDASSAPLWQSLVTGLVKSFDGAPIDVDGGYHRRVSLFMENLAATEDGGVVKGSPPPSYALPEAIAADAGYPVSFQMLAGWGFAEYSLAHGGDGGSSEGSLAGSQPIDAMQFALGTYGARYFEIYYCDADMGQATYIDLTTGEYTDAGPIDGGDFVTFNVYRALPSEADAFTSFRAQIE